MLFPFINQCTFEDSDKAQTKLRSLSGEAENTSSDFGGWLSSPRKRKSKIRVEDGSPEKKGGSGGSDKVKLCKNDSYYKKYRTDPLEGTFKHFMNYSQYIKVYRENTTLCYKQKTLNELSSLYSATLDVGSNWPSYGHGIECEDNKSTSNPAGIGNRSDIAMSWQEALNEQARKNNVTSQRIGMAPLMLLPTAPSIPSPRLSADEKALGIGQPLGIMCNAYLNRNTVCPVHRLIHRRNVVLSDRNNRAAGILPGMRLEHIKVELPGIPKRRYNVQIKRLRNNRESLHNSSEDFICERGYHAPPNSKGTTPRGTPGPVDEDEDSAASERINALLSHNHILWNTGPCEKISNALSRHKKSSEIMPSTGSMQLPITALLQYFPTHNFSEVPSKIKTKPMQMPVKPRFLSQRNLIDTPRKEIKQCDKVNYEKQYERYLSDVLESKGRAIQKRHYQNLSKNH